MVVIPKSTHQQRIEENFAIWDFSLTEKEMAQISSLDLGYVGESVKHFNPEFVRGCLAVKYMIDINHVFYLRRQESFNRE